MATLEQLTGMGFSEDAAKAALEAHGPTGGALDALLGLAPHHSTQVSPCKFFPFFFIVDAAQPPRTSTSTALYSVLAVDLLDIVYRYS